MNTLEILKRPVKEYMTTDVITVLTNSQLEEAKTIFDTNSIHHLPVVDDENRLEGIISKTDLLLLMDWGTKYDLTSSKRKNAFLLKSNLAIDLMEENVVTVGADDTVEKCYDIFKENYFHAIPVVDEDHKLIGLITTYDLLIAAYSQPMAVK
ncbi:MAG: CBS domain-containing protein [Saprospiraceae bacterium]|nr:CBS domain-containing protein [Saprospiraceae bacterium]